MLSVYLSVIEDEEDRLLFEKIYRKFRQPMMYMARSILSDDMDAEDAVHDVFAKVATKHMPLMRRMDNKTDIKNYLLKAVKNTALNMTEKKKRAYISIDDVNAAELIDGSDISDDDFVSLICRKSDYETVVRAIRDLDRTYSEVLYFHFVLEMPVGQVAELLNRKTATVKKQLVRGKKLLLVSLDLNGGDINADD